MNYGFFYFLTFENIWIDLCRSDGDESDRNGALKFGLRTLGIRSNFPVVIINFIYHNLRP